MPRRVRRLRRGQGRPVTGLPAGGNGTNILRIDGVCGALHPLSKAAGHAPLNNEEGHNIPELLHIQIA
ncbi:MAG: hypothetical protein JW395_3528 [Nitrospira sp.]|nr:hypothetical protein [Nitrospira sp.]